MKIKRTTIEFTGTPSSLDWDGEQLIDWVDGGCLYKLDGKFVQSGRRYSYSRFDSAIQFIDGDIYWTIIYEKRGTKGLLLKNGEDIREINRSYYQADVYEYPIAFFKMDNEVCIAHCPDEYNKLEIEHAESGKRLIQVEGERDLKDCFISRLRVNKTNTHLLNAGWVWHPVDIFELYDIKKGIQDPKHFDTWSDEYIYSGDIVSAEFLGKEMILIATCFEGGETEAEENKLVENQIGLYHIEKKKYLKIATIDFNVGTFIPINEDYGLSLYKYPKLVDLNTGKIIQKFEDIYSGEQGSSIIHHLEKIPPIAIDIEQNRIAIGIEKGIEILTFLDD